MQYDYHSIAGEHRSICLAYLAPAPRDNHCERDFLPVGDGFVVRKGGNRRNHHLSILIHDGILNRHEPAVLPG